VLTTYLEKDQTTARRLASVVLTLLTVLLTGLVVLGELIFGLISLVWGDANGLGLLLGLSAVMLPYLMLICIAAQLTTMLHAVQHFAMPAFAPTLLNIVWLAAAWGVAPWFAPNKEAQAYVLGIAVVIAGVAQVVVQLPMIHRLGYRFDYDWPAASEGFWQIVRNFAPMLLGLAATQINTFLDSQIAWGLTASPNGPKTIAWLGDAVRYPMEQGAVAAIYYGSRLYEFPLGILGMAVAVAIFPLLSQHATRGDRVSLKSDIMLGLHLVLCLSIPATFGLILMGEPIARLLFQHGNFSSDDTIRTARMIAWFATGVWAYCATPVLVRCFYAMNDRNTPVRIAVWMVGLNLCLNLTLIWPMAERGLALSTSVAAAVQTILLAVLFSRRHIAIEGRPLFVTTLRTLLASAVMVGVVLAALSFFPDSKTIFRRVLQVGIPISSGIVAYAAAFRLLGGRELGMLIYGNVEPR
jgi:putative peptidoglycan lipid II flippase